MQVVLTAYLRDGEELSSDEQDVTATELAEMKQLMCELMKSAEGFVRLTQMDTTLVVGRRDIVYVAIREV